ncbi:DHCW motif cupin fold protein [Cryobacterium sp. N19]|uniref:DHCW motif cupin fold protein n=1 Tax=Cryobacterium sp. N19 TaxID=2048288 RepID=UPI000CE55E01|nr:DHCW motif cupin fold protein [Cryobacterium sp. N19]
MEFVAHPFSTIDWNDLTHTVHPGATGEAHWRSAEIGSTRMRMVEYSPGYVADHWCTRGHLLLVLEGELHTELGDGRVADLIAGQSYQVGSEMESHQSSTTAGARLFIVD